MKFNIIALLLLIPALLFSQDNLTTCEYWFDGDMTGAENIAISPSTRVTWLADLDISALNDGLHVVHLRFGDEGNKWSGTVSRYFVTERINAMPADGELSSLQYWFDTGISEAVTTTLTPGTTCFTAADIPATALATGLHTFHFRVSDSNGMWSGTVSRFFIIASDRAGSAGSVITGMEYWIDGDISSAVKIENPGNIINLPGMADLSGLPDGLHTLGARITGENNLSSGAVSGFFKEKCLRPMEATRSPVTGTGWMIR
ncbi:MAG: hypothetical protein R2744_09180 [Bacteroidales bacterium]